MTYKIFFKHYTEVFFVELLDNCLEVSWTTHARNAMEFDGEEQAQKMVDILQDKYPKLTLETTYFLWTLS